ncbi:MAG: C-terminal binding protein [Planctomycetota bacterium]|nr:C-terminal binding protein [Planctomycetota bacterium]
MNEQRVLLTDKAWPNWDIEHRILSEANTELITAPDTSEATLIQLARSCDAIGSCWANVTTAVIEAATNCLVISRFGIGLDNIDVATATRRGIPVTNVPDYCVEEVSDHVIALLMAHARNVGYFHRRTKQGEYQLQAAPPMRRLTELTLGIVGFGRIGRAVFRKAQGLGLQVVAHSRSGDDHGTGCHMVSFAELVHGSDFVSLNLPSTAETRHMFRAAVFSAMKSTAVLINTSRGMLIQHDDLWSALQQGVIAGAALDVFDPEPPDLSLPLYQDERVILTPHAAFVSEESVIELRTRAVTHIVQALRGERPDCVVNSDFEARVK